MRTSSILCFLCLLPSFACGGSATGDAVPAPAPPAAPAGLAATAGNRQVTLKWKASGSAERYRVKRWAAENSPFTPITIVSGTSYVDSGLINGTTYRYKVSAMNAGGEGPDTAEVSANLATAPVFKLAWSDEFDGVDGTQPSAAKWTYDLGGGGWGNHELETYTARPANAQIQGGQLVITAAKETYTGTDNIARDYTSARLKTQGVYSQQYGKIEARIKLPKGQGIWPAFWMIGDNIGSVSWPACGEIDIMENIGREPSTNHGSLHGNGYSAGNSLTATWQLPGGSLGDDFHVYTLIWAKDIAQFYVDDILYQIRSAADVPAGSVWAFNHPFFLILNIAVGSDQSWPGAPDASTVFPQRMYVDWVRVYDLD